MTRLRNVDTSYYAPTKIPVDVFYALPAADLFGPGTDSRKSRSLFRQALRGLDSVGLIEGRQDDPTMPGTSISVHPVVSDANRAQLGGQDPDAASIRHSSVDLLTAAVTELRYDRREDWPRYRLLGRHLLALLDTVAEHVDRERLKKLMSATALTVRAFNRTQQRCAYATNSPGRSRTKAASTRHTPPWSISVVIVHACSVNTISRPWLRGTSSPG